MLNIRIIFTHQTAANSNSSILILEGEKKSIQPHEYLRIKNRIIIHHKKMRKPQLITPLNSFFHPTTKTACTTSISIWNNCDQLLITKISFAHLAKFIIRAKRPCIIYYKYMNMLCYNRRIPVNID